MYYTYFFTFFLFVYNDLSAEAAEYDEGGDVGGELNPAGENHVEVPVPVQVRDVVRDTVVTQGHCNIYIYTSTG